ncbi:hypothetical protein [Methanosalsum natronophilum]|uniref:hypothetical protein n=1 Tax=Methanosalsum natronophilum TaxID=768733 RepID=UPI0021677F6E|nr:hypothetical protein [Methanosalsum natronophilum]MCS3923570.1 hypothetical protein [Methanosalsum natronophilum]
MRWKLSLILLAAIVCLAMTGVSAADDVKFCWEKPCGTIVEQCDKETVFTLNDVDPETEIVKTTHGYVYVSMRNVTNVDGDRVIAPGDIRLSNWHDKYEPNTKVNDTDADGVGTTVISEIIDVPLKYMDINENGIYDLYDPVYVDVNGDGVVSSGDIRLTAVPPVDVYSLEMVEGEYGTLLWEAGEWGYEAWSVVRTGDADRGEELIAIGSGQASDLLGYVDADDSGDWTCPDKLYIRAPNVHDWFQNVVTINDVRLYIPPDEECVPECGTKVVQGDKDATYALTPIEATLVQLRDEPTAIYINMDGSPSVSVGDIRLTGVSTEYDRKTKVTFSDRFDLGAPYATTPMDQNSIKYADIDGIGGYSLGDPLYIDVDGSGDVSDGDFRLTDVPLFAKGDMTKGQAGEAGTIVKAGPTVTDDADAGWELKTIGNINDIIGYIDSDATGTWTCPDKLYFQQLYESRYTLEVSNGYGWEFPHDMFVTVGDYRVYEPISDVRSPFYGLEEWPESSNKVFMCNKDATYVLTDHFMPIEELLRYADLNQNNRFDVTEPAYIDMDNSGTVTVGDIRLTDVTIDGEFFYENNTKVVIHDKDIGVPLKKYSNGEYTWFAHCERDLLSLIEEDMVLDGKLGFSIKIFDADCSKDWTCVDGLYIQRDHEVLGTASEGYNPVNMDFVTHMNGRLFIPPEYIADNVNDEDNDNNNGIDEPVTLEDVIAAINEYMNSNGESPTLDQVVSLINAYMNQ